MSENQIVPQQQNSALALPEEYPAYLRDLYVPRGYATDAGPLTPGDIGTNFVKIVQRMSKEAIAGWGPDRNEPAIPLGTMFLSRDRKVIPIDTPVFPLLRTIKFLRWEGRPGEGKLIGTADRRDDERILREDGLQFRRDANGKTLPPLWTEYINIYVACRECKGEPIVISFYRTSRPVGRKWVQLLLRATLGFSLPLYSHKYKLGSPCLERSGDQTWYQLVIKPDGFTPEEFLPRLKSLYQDAVAMNQASQGTEYLNLEAGAAPEPEEAPNMFATEKTNDLPDFIDVAATPVAPAPALAPAPVKPSTPAPTPAPAPAPTPAPVVEMW
jgi:hypothetical protein